VWKHTFTGDFYFTNRPRRDASGTVERNYRLQESQLQVSRVHGPGVLLTKERNQWRSTGDLGGAAVRASWSTREIAEVPKRSASHTQPL
jgi:hypothetical protein